MYVAVLSCLTFLRFGIQATMSQKDLNNHSNQLNPNNPTFYKSRGISERPSDWDTKEYKSSPNYTQADLNNHANQLNPNNPLYQPPQSKGNK
ncbi:hypothetical protein GWI33_015132 [Rhynchophorus ferrugineus]|uniref:Uncharacterized protein n=1 Tax=Rhynchophorus ferrugineus TaxID=354439 RepID=A0A834I3V2_RHYFE|nr:hypothetical protein GWI33_015132 [Rhynchophorus ferrugineus]